MKKESGDLAFRTSARVGLVRTYLEIAIDSYKELLIHQKELNDIQISEARDSEQGSSMFNPTREIEVSNRLRKDTIKTVIFISIFLESYINDFAGIVLGDRYSKEHLDKLDLISKWIIIPRLITGKEISKNRAYFGQLKDLVKWRNKLVHPKSKDASFLNGPWTNDTAKQLQPIYDQIDIDNLFNMVEELFKELDTIDKPGFHLFSIQGQLLRLKKV